MTSTPILFLGPVRAGKTTLARLVAARLGLPHISLDEMRWDYYREVGFDPDLEQNIRASGGFLALVFYRQLFDIHSVERIVEEHADAVIDVGAGVGPYECKEHLRRVQDLLAPLPNVFLILPSPDARETLRVLRQRDPNPPSDLFFDINAHFLGHPGYRLLAKHTVYNQDKTPEQSCAEIVALLK